MASQEAGEPGQLFSGTSAAGAQAYATYDRLMRQSRKLGMTATRTWSEASQGARQILKPRGRRAPIGSGIEELKKAVAHSREVLAESTTIIPFLFPHEVILDRTKITIIKRNFFWSSDVISIRIEDILSVSACVGPLFGSVTVASRVMSSVDHFEIDRFWRRDAVELKQVIQGYLLARHNGLRTDDLSHDELVEALRELGRDT